MRSALSLSAGNHCQVAPKFRKDSHPERTKTNENQLLTYEALLHPKDKA